MSAFFGKKVSQRILLALTISSILAISGLSVLEFSFMRHHQDELLVIDAAHHGEVTAIQIKKWLSAALSARHAYVITGDPVHIEALDDALSELDSLLPTLDANAFARLDHIRSEIDEFFRTLTISMELRRQSPAAFNEQLMITYEGEERRASIGEDLDLDLSSWTASALDAHLSAGIWQTKLENIERISISATALLVVCTQLALLVEIRVRRRAEQRLKKILREPMSLLESHPLPVIARDCDDKVILWNSEMQHEFQFADKDFADSSFVLESPASADRLHRMRLRALNGAGIGRVEIEAHRADGTLCEAIATVSAIRDETGDILGTVTVYGDVSELKKNARERVASVLNQRDILVREVNHTVKNNLQGVANLIQLQMADYSELADVRNKIAGQLRAIAAIHSLRSKVSGSLQIGESLREIVEIVALSFDMPINLIDHLDDSGKVIAISETVPVTLVVTELLINSLKHSSSSSAGRSAPEITVSDAGLGVEIRIVNEGRLSGDLSIDDGTGLGEGLKLCLALLPADFAELRLSAEDEIVSAVLILKPPLFDAAIYQEHVA